MTPVVSSVARPDESLSPRAELLEAGRERHRAFALLRQVLGFLACSQLQPSEPSYMADVGGQRIVDSRAGGPQSCLEELSRWRF